MMTQFKSPHTNVMPPLRHLDLYADLEIPVPESYHSKLDGRSDYLSHTWMRMRGMKSPDVLKTGPSKGAYTLSKRGTKRGGRKVDALPKFYSCMTPAQLETWHAHYDPVNEAYARRLAAGEVPEKEQAEFPYQRYVKDYLRCVAAIDENVGRLLDHLDQAGLAENTIVIYSSDQGFFLGENGWTDKRLMDEVTMSMPFLIRWPGKVKPGQRIEALIQNIDYAPTFLEAAGIPVPGDMDGRSLLPVFGGKVPEDWRESLYYQYHQAGAYNLPKIEGVRTERYKLIRYFGHPRLKLGEQWELFDLEKDLAEQRSEHANPEYASVVEMMRAELGALRKQFGAGE
jgi:N-acetylglucosamine-6-sulfatase